jgi:hypothetical protein
MREYTAGLMASLGEGELQEITACLKKLVAAGRAQRAAALQAEQETAEI